VTRASEGERKRRQARAASRAETRRARHRGQAKVGWMFTFTAAAYNLVRLRNLAVAA
jgi:hypothetical protein